jgi:hypothetical protein
MFVNGMGNAYELGYFTGDWQPIGSFLGVDAGDFGIFPRDGKLAINVSKHGGHFVLNSFSRNRHTIQYQLDVIACLLGSSF